MAQNRIDPLMPIWNSREIEFASGSKARGIDILMSTGAPVRVIGKNRFIVSDTQCKVLKQKRVNYKIIK